MVNIYRSDVIAERRRYPRKPLNLFLKFELANPQNNPPARDNSQTENISSGGLALYSEHKLEKGQEISLVLYLPPKEKRSSEIVVAFWTETECIPISIQARIAWRLPFINNKYAYGAEFISIDPNDKPAFDEFLADFYLHKPCVI